MLNAGTNFCDMPYPVVFPQAKSATVLAPVSLARDSSEMHPGRIFPERGAVVADKCGENVSHPSPSWWLRGHRAVCNGSYRGNIPGLDRD